MTPLASALSAPPSAQLWLAIAARLAPSVAAERGRVPRWIERWFERWFKPWFEPRPLGTLAAGLFMGLFMGITLALLGPSLLDRGATDIAGSADTPQLPESYVGVLAAADGRTGVIVSSRRHGRVMDVKQVQPVPVAAGHTLYLWAIDADGSTRPIGPVPPGRFVQVALAQTSEVLFGKAIELALSIEAATATPLSPNAPFVYRGLCGKLWRVPPPQKK